MKPRLTYANVTSSIALFVALGGVSYAATALPANSVGSKQIVDKSISSTDLADKAVTSAKLEPSLISLFRGQKGDTGIQGPRGDAGAMGPTGARGDKGETGAVGQQGPKGDTGATGPAGPSDGYVADFTGDNQFSVVSGTASRTGLGAQWQYGDPSREETRAVGTVGAGSYLIVATLGRPAGNWNTSVQPASATCELLAPNGVPVAQASRSSNSTDDLTFIGAIDSAASAGTLAAHCMVGGSGLYLSSGADSKLTAQTVTTFPLRVIVVKVGKLN